MAKRYGKGYYSDWYEMINSIQEGSKKALKSACQELCDDINQRIRGGIYSGEHPTYERTNELANIDYVTCDVKGLECQFLYDNQEFAKITPYNPEHHALSNDKGNGYDTQAFMDDIISPIHDDFMVDIRYYIQNNFADVYRKHCKAIGFELK